MLIVENTLLAVRATKQLYEAPSWKAVFDQIAKESGLGRRKVRRFIELELRDDFRRFPRTPEDMCKAWPSIERRWMRRLRKATKQPHEALHGMLELN